MTARPVVVEHAFTVNAPLDRVWAFMRNPALISACIPGVSDVTRRDDGTFNAVVQVTLSLIKARFELLVRIAEEQPPFCLIAEIRGEDGKTGTLLETRNRVDLSAGAGETEVAFRIDAKLTGKLAALGGGSLVKLTSRRMARDFAANVKERIETEG